MAKQPPKKKIFNSNAELRRDEAEFDAAKKMRSTVRNTSKVKFGRNHDRDMAAAKKRLAEVDSTVMAKATALGSTVKRTGQKPFIQR